MWGTHIPVRQPEIRPGPPATLNEDRVGLRLQGKTEHRSINVVHCKEDKMGLRKFGGIFIVLFFLVIIDKQIADGQDDVSPKNTSVVASPATSSVRTILEVLNKAHASGSLEFTGACTSLDYPNFPEFPHVSTPSELPESPVDALRALFLNTPHIHISKDQKGIFRLTEHGVQEDVLRLKISRISFENERGGIYGANAALNFVLWSPDMKRYMESHNTRFPFEGGPISVLYGSKPVSISLPHIGGADLLPKISATENQDSLVI